MFFSSYLSRIWSSFIQYSTGSCVYDVPWNFFSNKLCTWAKSLRILRVVDMRGKRVYSAVNGSIVALPSRWEWRVFKKNERVVPSSWKDVALTGHRFAACNKCQWRVFHVVNFWRRTVKACCCAAFHFRICQHALSLYSKDGPLTSAFYKEKQVFCLFLFQECKNHANDEHTFCLYNTRRQVFGGRENHAHLCTRIQYINNTNKYLSFLF